MTHTTIHIRNATSSRSASPKCDHHALGCSSEICTYYSAQSPGLLVVRSLILTALFLLQAVARLSATEVTFTQYDISSGLFNDQTRDVIAMPDRRMLVTVDGMLCLFDGYSFRNISIDRTKTVAMESFVNMAHYFDKRNLLWIRNYHELMAIDTRTYNLVSVPDLMAKTGLKEELKNFFLDADGNAWLVTLDDKLYLYDFKSEARLVLSIVSKQRKELWPTITDVVEANGLHYIFVSDGTMRVWNQRERRFVGHHVLVERKFGYRLRAWAYDDNTLLVRTGIVLLAYNIVSGQSRTLLDEPNVADIAFDGKGGFTVISRNGICHFDKTFRSTCYDTVVNKKTGKAMSNDWFGIAYDWQGGLWISSLADGLFYKNFDEQPSLSEILPLSYSEPKMNEVSAVLPYATDTLYVLTHAGLFSFCPSTKSFAPVPAMAGIVGKSMSVDGKGVLWISTQREGLISYCPSTGERRTHVPAPMGFNFCYEIGNDIYMTCFHGNIITIYTLDNGKSFDVTQTHPEMLGLRNIVCAIPANGGYMLGTQNGYVWLNPKTKAIDLNKYKTLNDNRFSNKCNALLRDRDGMIWIGTPNGLLRYNEQTGEVKRYAERQGLLNSCIQGLSLDRDNNIWVTTANGVCYLKRGAEFVNFISRLTEVKTDAHFLERAICAGPDGKIYMGTSVGLQTVNPALLYGNTSYMPQVTNFNVFANKVMDGQLTGSYNVYARIKDNVIHLNHDENYFRVDVSTLNYRDINMTVYRYRLNGIDTGWRISDKANGTVDISYSGLPSGHYTLEVQSSMQGAQWGKSMKLEIIIDPPFWATWWAFTAYILLIVGAVWLGLRHYLRRKREVIEQERKEAYHRDEQRLNEMKFRFFTNISHEFRTFLTLIITPLQTLLERDDLPRDAMSRLQVVKRSTQSLNTLVNQLLDFRSLEQGGEQLDASVIHLSTLFEPIEPTFAGLAADRNIEFSVDTEQIGDATFYLDVPKVQKIINNLLSNAFKFTPDGGRVTLRAWLDKRSGHLLISVSDTGVGMSKKDLKHIFERFFQGSTEQQDTQLNTGSGIGLNLVKGYTDLHHGEISVESELDKGTTFTVDLPNNQPATEQTADGEQPSDETPQEPEGDEEMPKDEKVKLLVVEDNKDFRSFMVDMLKDQYTVFAANDGEEALSTARVTVPDIIISDVMMPKMDGYQLCKAVKENIKLSHIPIVLLTAKTTDQDRAEGYQAGADSYITKPFNMSVLQACVQMLLDQRRDRQQEFANETEVNPKKLTITPIDEEFLKKAIRLMEKNMTNSEYDVVAFSSDMAMERTTLYRKMVAVVGKTPLQFMHSVRMKRATVLLKEGKYSVAEVAAMVGYDTVKTFSQHFKKEYGEYPSKYH